MSDRLHSLITVWSKGCYLPDVSFMWITAQGVKKMELKKIKGILLSKERTLEKPTCERSIHRTTDHEQETPFCPQSWCREHVWIQNESMIGDAVVERSISRLLEMHVSRSLTRTITIDTKEGFPTPQIDTIDWAGPQTNANDNGFIKSSTNEVREDGKSSGKDTNSHLKLSNSLMTLHFLLSSSLTVHHSPKDT